MTPPTSSRPWSGAAVLPASVALYLLLAARMGPFTPDDAYISFRYAQHLAAGAGLTFNAGAAPVEGYSNFLWILICGAFAGLRLDLIEWSRWAGLACGVATLAVAWRMLVRRGVAPPHQAVVLLALASAGPFVLYSISGLETALFGLLLLVTLMCAERCADSGPVWLAGLAAGGVGLALCRPEGIVVFPLVLVLLIATGSLRQPRAAVLAGAAGFVLAVAVYHVWRTSYFGELLPTPFHSKGAGGALVHAWTTNLRYLFVRQNHYFAPLGWYDAGFAGLALIGQAAILARSRRVPVTAVPLAAALACAALYMNFVDWMPGMRYMAPLLAPVMVSLAPFELRFGGTANGSAGARLGTAAALVAVLAAGLGSVALLTQDARRNEESTRASQAALGRWLAAAMPGDALLAVSDVGAIPYYSGLRTMDINPRSLTDVRIATEGWSDAYFFERDPDVVILVSFSATRPAFYGEHLALYETPAFRERYTRVGVTRYDRPMDRCYWVFTGPRVHLTERQTRDLPAGVGAE